MKSFAKNKQPGGKLINNEFKQTTIYFHHSKFIYIIFEYNFGDGMFLVILIFDLIIFNNINYQPTFDNYFQYSVHQFFL